MHLNSRAAAESHKCINAIIAAKLNKSIYTAGGEFFSPRFIGKTVCTARDNDFLHLSLASQLVHYRIVNKCCTARPEFLQIICNLCPAAHAKSAVMYIMDCPAHKFLPYLQLK